MKFIFMLTRNDRTVESGLEVLEAVLPLGVRHIGFKDVGVERPVLRLLNEAIQAAGGTSYMEVVSTTREECLDSVRIAAEIGVDRLLGGTLVDETLAILAGGPVAYFPFVGRPEGHPTRLGGSAAKIADDCGRASDLGCAGVDLLAYRAFEAEPGEVLRAARRATRGELIVAGSIDSPERVGVVHAAGADAFTVGTAVFDGAFSPGKGDIASQIVDILAVAG
jgi:hypothetical protein